MRWARLFLPAAVLLAACSDDSAVTPDGSPGMYFLQPVETAGEPTAPLNRDLLPSVEICRLIPITTGPPSERYPRAGTACEEDGVIKRFEANSFQPTEESYRLNWDTDDTNEPDGLSEDASIEVISRTTPCE